jgi:preprotein translocase subunit YajC
LFQLISVLATTVPAKQVPNAGMTTLFQVGFLGLLFVGMYFLMIRPQKKKQKAEQKMRNSVRVGDEITTIGGITGRVLNIKEDALVIETGADRTKMTVKKWALQSVDTIHEAEVEDDDDDFDDDDDI